MKAETLIAPRDDTARTAGLVASWGRRASVRRGHHAFEPGSLATNEYQPDRPDYPQALAPGWVQDRMAAATADQRSKALTLAWLVYNHRVIAAEEEVAVPAMKLLLSDRYPSLSTPDMR